MGRCAESPPVARRLRAALALSLAALASPAPAPAAAPAFASSVAWVEARSEHVTVMSDVGAGAATDAARKLERLVRVMAQLTPGLRGAPAGAVSVVLLADAAQAGAYALAPSTEDPGAFTVRGVEGDWIVIAAGRGGAEGRTGALFHQYAHVALRASLATLPAWVDEGLARYYGEVRVADRWSEAGSPDPDQLRWARQQAPMSLDEMFAMSTQAHAYLVDNPLQRSFRAQSFALVLYLESPVRGDASGFDRYLARLREGAPARSAFAELVDPARWSALPAVARHHLEEVEFEPARRVESGERLDETPVRVRALTTGEALGRLGILLAGAGPAGLDAARDHLRGALAGDSTVAASWAARGWLADLDGDSTAAERAYARGRALDPAGAGPALWAGLGTLERARRAARTDARAPALPGLVALARDRLRARLRLAPDDPVALAAYGRSYLVGGESDSAAVRALERALALQPGRHDVAVDLEAARAAAYPRLRPPVAAETPEGPQTMSLRTRRSSERATSSLRRSEFARLYNEGVRAMNAGDFEKALSWLEHARDVTDVREERLFAGRGIVRIRSWIATRDARAAIAADRLSEARELLDGARTLPLSDVDRARLDAIAGEVDSRRRIDEALALAARGQRQQARAIYGALLARPLPAGLQEFVRARLRELGAVSDGP